MFSLTRMVVAVGLIALASIAKVEAQTFPTRPVTVIVPWPAGGPTDLVLRALAETSQKHLGQPIVIENKPGASGLTGPSIMVATAKPDGYTLAQLAITVFRLPQMIDTAFDPAKDFTYIINLAGGSTFGIVVKKDAPWKTFREMIDYAKANPGKIRFGTSGLGTTQHVTMEQIAKREGVKWTHVPFKGSAELNSAALGGHVEAIADSSGWGALVDSGDLRLLVTWGAERSKKWPEVPTLRETGIDLVSYSPMGIAGPKGMDGRTVQILHDAFRKGMSEPAFQASLDRFDQLSMYLNSDDYRKYAMELIAEEKRVVQEYGLKKQ